MLATLIDAPCDDPARVFETEWDGFRMVTEIKDGVFALYSRNEEVVSERYKPITQSLRNIKHNCVLRSCENVSFFARSGVTHLLTQKQNGRRLRGDTKNAHFVKKWVERSNASSFLVRKHVIGQTSKDS